MSLQLILGGSGSGKTTYLYDTIIQSSMEHPERQYFFIVPEQFTMQTQKDVVTRHPRHGTMNIDIVSFQRLAYRVFEELAVENLQVLDDMGKSMVLRKVAAAQRKKLILFQGHLNQNGFVSQMKSMLSEFYQYGITPEQLKELAPQAKTPLLKQKLEDFALVFESFQEYIAGHYITTEEVLDVLCRVLPQSEMMKNSIVALDGYTGFTPVQYRLLELFMVHAKQVCVTVTADPEMSVYKVTGMQNLFHMSQQMVCRLSKLAEDNQVKKLEDVWLKGSSVAGGTDGKDGKDGKDSKLARGGRQVPVADTTGGIASAAAGPEISTEVSTEAGTCRAVNAVAEAAVYPRFVKSPEIAYLEKSLFRYRRGHYTGEMTGSLELSVSANPSGEVSAVVHRIQQLVQDSGLRYRDMAVITGDLVGYGKEIAHQFDQNEIPYFLDDKKNVLDNPMVELIRGALEAVRKDLSYESVFRYLRTGLVSSDKLMTDRLENYVLAMGIRGGRRWRETWERTYRGGANLNLVELNAFKDQMLAPLFAMQEAFRKDAGQKNSIAEMTEAVRTLLADCQVEEKLQAYGEYFAGQKEYRLAKEYGQLYGLVDELLNRLSDLLGEEEVSRKEFMEILDAGFAEISVGVIPATVDRVVVGDITRTRLAHVKVLFFVGVNDGIVPMRKDGGSLLSDQEREFFGEHSLELAPTAREDSFQQRFYLYLMMTKPSQKLVLSYSNVGGDGKSRRASYLIAELRKMFPALVCQEDGKRAGIGMTTAAEGQAKKTGSEQTGESCEVYSVAEARKKLIEGLRAFRDDGAESEEFKELYRWFISSGEHQAEARRLVEAAFYIYEKQGIGHAVAQALYGNIISGSVTRLEQYAACAYGHFLKYGLELAERQRYELAAADIGNLFHDSIDLCFQRMKDEGHDWKTITDENRTELVRQCVEKVTSDYGNTILNSSSRNAYLAKRVEHITQRTIWALQQQICKGDFTPAGFELNFSAADNLQAMKISLSEDEALHLRGRIDRMDLCEEEQQVYVKIIDYKSGSTSFDLLALYYGLQLQLVVYMDAVMELTSHKYPNKEVVPAGILYYNIADPLVAKSGQQTPEEIDAQILRQLRMNGLINSELEAIRHLDNTIEKESDIIPVVLKDGNVQESKSSVANRERFASLRGFVHEKLKGTGREILDGNIGVEPYKSGPRTACDYCPYHAVCGFDKKVTGYEYRRWKNKKSEEIWEEICQENQ